ncbi:MAG: insulinase family protein [Oscillospiraceae bacterium]|nr:insulinase family protein [Oscillospiraceae bacterium]
MTNAEIKKINVAHINEEYFEFTHRSGLKVVVCPMKGYATSCAFLGPSYGSINNCFAVPNGEFVTVPEGIAHFLEHKLFESENGQDVFELFAATGANANAFTSFEKTRYHFSGTQEFHRNLEILLNFVTSPYFSDENVKKEQGIITQEIKMYEDSPSWQVFFNALRAMYIKHPVRIDTAGEVESISKITKDLLYICYNSYYSSSNMTLAATGEVKLEEVLSVVDELYDGKEPLPKPLENFIPKEPLHVNEQIIRKSLPVSIPLVDIGFKEESLTESENFLNRLKYDILLNMLFGETSELFKKCYDDGIVTKPFELQTVAGNGFVSLIIESETKNPETLYQLVIDEVKKRQNGNLSQDDFQRFKKVALAEQIRLWEDPVDLASKLSDLARLDFNLNDILELVINLKFEDVEKLLDNGLKEERSVLSVIDCLL